MSSLPAAPVISPEEYLRRERLAEFKSEYIGGEIVAMSGANRFHNRISMSLTTTLAIQLRDRPCRVYGSDMRVSVRGGKSYLYPDVSVTCGQETFEDHQFDSLTNPVVVIEILSESTESRDRGRKFQEYQAIPTLREYVLITQSPRRFEIFRRRDDGPWLYESWAFDPPPLVLESIGCTLSADEVYFKFEDVKDDRGPIPQ